MTKKYEGNTTLQTVRDLKTRRMRGLALWKGRKRDMLDTEKKSLRWIYTIYIYIYILLYYTYRYNLYNIISCEYIIWIWLVVILSSTWIALKWLDKLLSLFTTQLGGNSYDDVAILLSLPKNHLKAFNPPHQCEQCDHSASLALSMRIPSLLILECRCSVVMDAS